MDNLDNQHIDFQKKYLLNKKKAIKLESENKKLKSKLQDSNVSFVEKLDIKDQIKKNKKIIKKYKLDEKKYYTKNSKDIFEYFENKKNIQTNQNKKITVNDFFSANTSQLMKKNNTINKNVENFMNNNGFCKFDNKYCYQDSICQICKSGELIEQNSEGVKICNQCGNSVKFIVQNIKPSYKDPPKDVSFYAYKRINHFREILAQFQAKESTTISDEIIERIKKQIEKERITINELSNQKTKELLKKLGYNKYYEHISFIKEKLGISPPLMSSALEETLCNLFIEIQIPYAKYCPKNRVNFLNYYYTIYKLCEMLNYKEFLPYFPMLKDREKIIEQDQIWKKICQELNWNFIHTV